MRDIRFRVWDNKNNCWIAESLDISLEGRLTRTNKPNHSPNKFVYDYELMQYTGLIDKNGKEIYEGDCLSIKWVKQNWQTHTGDNIPFGGSYTEPDVSTIEEIKDGYVVIFKDGAFRMGGDYDMPDGCYDDLLSTFLSDFYSDVFLNMDDDYFSEEGFYTLAELKETLGVEIIGNIYQNPQLISE